VKKIKFEYKITAAYLIIGVLWIVFSDKIVNFFVDDSHLMTIVQTFKGWFYVCATAFLFFIFLRKHLHELNATKTELLRHKDKLKELVDERTCELETVIEELNSTNEELYDKSNIINDKNTELSSTLSELKAAQSQLVHAEKMASLGVLTAGVAHEINNPLNYIHGGSTGLRIHLQENENYDETSELMINSINSGVERVSSIISGLNQFSRNSSKNNELCNIHEIIDNSLLMLNNQIKHRIDVKKQYTNENFRLLGNVGKLHQVFLNILQNANQAIEDKGEIEVHTKVIADTFQIKITDTGSGIPKDIISKITDPFFTTKKAGEGTGLGLSISYSIIKEHNGLIEFYSDEKNGTCVEILLPVQVN